MNQMNLTNIHRALHWSTEEHTFFSATHGMLLKVFHIPGHKVNLNKHRKIEIKSYILPDPEE